VESNILGCGFKGSRIGKVLITQVFCNSYAKDSSRSTENLIKTHAPSEKWRELDDKPKCDKWHCCGVQRGQNSTTKRTFDASPTTIWSDQKDGEISAVWGKPFAQLSSDAPAQRVKPKLQLRGDRHVRPELEQ
jgi:hypothetical protein